MEVEAGKLPNGGSRLSRVLPIPERFEVSVVCRFCISHPKNVSFACPFSIARRELSHRRTWTTRMNPPQQDRQSVH